MSDQERSLLKEQILLFQQKLSEKETKYIKLDNELRKKKKEVERLQKRLDEGQEPKVPRVSNHQNTIEFDELMNTSIDAITQRIKIKHSKSKDRSPSIPKLNFRNMKEFQEQDWLSYAHRLEESI
jgi:predicted nuclease with TOPRIM domain